MLKQHNDAGLQKVIAAYFDAEIMLFIAHISCTHHLYDGNCVCWCNPGEIVFFTEELEHIVTVAREDIKAAVINPDNKDTIMMTDDHGEVTLTKTHF